MGAMGRGAALSTPAQGRWMGWEGVLPETWNLKPGTEVNSHTDGHGQTRTGTDAWRGQRAEFRGQGEPKGWREGIVDAPAGRMGSEGNGTASALGERSYRAELFFLLRRLRWRVLGFPDL